MTRNLFLCVVFQNLRLDELSCRAAQVHAMPSRTGSSQTIQLARFMTALGCISQDLQPACDLTVQLLSVFTPAAAAAVSEAGRMTASPISMLLRAAAAASSSKHAARVRAAAIGQLSADLYAQLLPEAAAEALKVRALACICMIRACNMACPSGTEALAAALQHVVQLLCDHGPAEQLQRGPMSVH